MRHLRYGAVLVALGTMVVFATGCPLTTFYVTYPTQSQNYTVNAGNQLVMTVRFSRDVAFNTLIAGTNVTLDTDTTANAAITITPGAAANEVVITTTDTVTNLLTFDPDGFFTLTITDDGVEPVKDSTGEALDGDKDNAAGGEFSMLYTMLG